MDEQEKRDDQQEEKDEAQEDAEGHSFKIGRRDDSEESEAGESSEGDDAEGHRFLSDARLKENVCSLSGEPSRL